MKNIFRISILTLLLLVTYSCTDDDKVLPIPPIGANVTFIPTTKVIDFAALDTSAFSGVIDDATGNIESFTVSAKIDKADGTSTSVVEMEVFTTFPSDLSFTGNFILGKLGITSSDVNPGDIVVFSGVALTTDGRSFGADSLNGDAAGAGLLGAFSLEAPFFCEFVVADAVGSYTATLGDWGGNGPYGDYLDGYVEPTVVTAIAGTEPNTIVFKDLLSPGFDLTVSVDPTTAIAVVDGSRVGSGFSGYTGAILNTSGTAFYFSCTGSFKATYKVCVDIGCFGTPVAIELQKN